jgi:hypothetical protein
MYVTVRRYQNAAALFEAMSAKKGEVQELISAVSGFVTYYSTRDGDTVTSVTVCNDKAGCDESTALAREWAGSNVNPPLTSPPEVSGGEVFINFSK